MTSISIGRYLFERLKQLGVKSIFGVPGDYELILLDVIPEVGLDWKGNPNELNASYAADGYARIKGVGACVTTFGPGELSGYCGLAGAYTEYVDHVPVAYIVGYPPSTAMKNHLIMHHSLGDGQFGAFHEMARNITVANTVISRATGAAAEIDRVLNDMLHYSRPVYIGLAVDMVTAQTPSNSLQQPLADDLSPNDVDTESRIVSKIANAVRALPRTVIIIDGLAIRNGVEQEVKELIQAAQVPYFVTFMAKGFDESLPRFGGLYAGGASEKPIQVAVESSDCVLWIGSYNSDFNTGEFTERVRPDTVVDFQRHHLTVRSKQYSLNIKHTLRALTKALDASHLDPKATDNKLSWDPYPTGSDKPERLTQEWLWQQLEHYVRDGDLIITETGTSSNGFPSTDLTKKKELHSYTQTIFGSIGYATGAALGSFVAAKEMARKGRNVLFTGEGSLQLTVQAFSDLMRHEVGATVFLLNNDGYTVERLIRGPEAAYNDVPIWDYSKLGELFGPHDVKNGMFKHHLIKTPDELLELFANEDFMAANPKKGATQVVELILDKLDAPPALKALGAAVSKLNDAKT